MLPPRRSSVSMRPPAPPPARRTPRARVNLPASAAAALLALFCSAPALLRATTLARMDLPQLARESTFIARARCVRVASRAGSGMVWTFSTFVVTEAWKGNPPSPFIVRMPGGKAAGLRVSVEGAPRFAVGEDVVLFLSGPAAPTTTILSWAQGTFRIRRNPRTGAEEAVQNTAGLRVFDSRSGAWSPGERRQGTLAALRARVAAALQDAAR